MHVFLLQHYNDEGVVNIGRGIDISIKNLAELIVSLTGYEGELSLDTLKPDGTPQKLLDCGKINLLGWRPSVSLLEGINKTIREYAHSLRD